MLVVGRISHYNAEFGLRANVAKLVDALDLGSSRAACGSSSLPIRTTYSIRDNPDLLIFYYRP